jgi:thiosulfate reductase cytochrome b subunit
MPANPDQHHPHHRKFNPTQAIESIGVVVFIVLGLAMLVGLLTAQGHLRLG